MTHEILIEITGWIIAGLAGWLLRGGVNSIQRAKERSHGKYEGYCECLAIVEPARVPGASPATWTNRESAPVRERPVLTRAK